jgi:hypothetical protein
MKQETLLDTLKPTQTTLTMIQSNELRIGNWYNFVNPMEGGKLYLTQFLNWTEYLDFEAYGEPIPLSAYILEKCGFENIYGETWSNGNVEILGRVPNFKDGYLLLNGEARTHWTSIYYYVHQLQNLYYALTQTELKIQL